MVNLRGDRQIGERFVYIACNKRAECNSTSVNFQSMNGRSEDPCLVIKFPRMDKEIGKFHLIFVIFNIFNEPIEAFREATYAAATG